MSATSGHKRQTRSMNCPDSLPGSRESQWRPPKHWEVDSNEKHGPVTIRQPTPEEQAQWSGIHQPDVGDAIPADPQVRLARVREQLTWLQERAASEPDEYQDCLGLIDSFTRDIKALEAEVARLRP